MPKAVTRETHTNDSSNVVSRFGVQLDALEKKWLAYNVKPWKLLRNI